MATFSELRTEVRRRAILDTGGAGELTSVNLMINNAQRQLQGMRRWNCLYRNTTFQTVADTAAYTLATRSTQGLLWHEEYGYPARINYITDEQYVSAGYDLNTTSKPEIAYVTGQTVTSGVLAQTIELWPVPDDAYTIHDSYYVKVTDMSADGDYPTFPNDFDELLIMMAVRKGKRFNEKTTESQELVADIRSEYARLAKWDSTLTPNYGSLRKRRAFPYRSDLDGLVTPFPAS